jgi:hypothetical protein
MYVSHQHVHLDGSARICRVSLKVSLQQELSAAFSPIESDWIQLGSDWDPIGIQLGSNWSPIGQAMPVLSSPTCSDLF